MPGRVIHMLASWKKRFAGHQKGDIWNVIPLCLMGTIWTEQNSWMFEGTERTMKNLKMIFFPV